MLCSCPALPYQALALADVFGMRPLVAHCHRGLDTLYRKIGRRERGAGRTLTALPLSRIMKMTFWLPQAKAELAQAE